MKRNLNFFLTVACLILAALISTHSQNGGLLSSAGAPSGGCSTNMSGALDVTTGNFYICTSGAWSLKSQPTLSGTSGSLGGGALLAGACSTTTVSVTGATTGMAVQVSPAANPGVGSVWYGYVSSANTVTVAVCGIVALTPTATTYNVRVIP